MYAMDMQKLVMFGILILTSLSATVWPILVETNASLAALVLFKSAGAVLSLIDPLSVNVSGLLVYK